MLTHNEIRAMLEERIAFVAETMKGAELLDAISSGFGQGYATARMFELNFLRGMVADMDEAAEKKESV